MKKWIREGLMLVLVGLAMLTPPAVRAAEPLAPVQVGQNIVRDEKFTIYLPQLAGLSDPAVAERLNGAINRDMDKGKAGFLQAWEEMQQAPLLPDNIKKSAHFWGTYAVKLNREGLFSLTVRQYFFTGGRSRHDGNERLQYGCPQRTNLSAIRYFPTGRRLS